MIKITNAVEQVLFQSEEALYAISKGFMNLSGFAALIQKDVERLTKKQVATPSIVVALSRLQAKVGKRHPMIVDVAINSVNTKSPVTEIVYDKSDTLIKKVASLKESVTTTADDFLSITMSTGEIGIICSDRIVAGVMKHFKASPIATERGLATMNIAVDPELYTRPNITYSLIRRIARKRIVLAETISNYREIIFVFKQQYLPEMLSLFPTT